jgi:hypothetical protein
MCHGVASAEAGMSKYRANVDAKETRRGMREFIVEPFELKMQLLFAELESEHGIDRIELLSEFLLRHFVGGGVFFVCLSALVWHFSAAGF